MKTVISVLLAFRPKTLTATLAPVISAYFLAVGSGLQPQLKWLLLVLLSAGCIQVATNLFNDAVDFKKGADTEKRVGPQRITQSGLLSYKQVMGLAGLFVILAMAAGLPIVIHGGFPLLAIGLVSLFLAYGYTGGPFPLAYIGLGDLFVFLFFGLIAVTGSFYVFTLQFSTASMVLGSQMGLLGTVLIAINNLRDSQQDVLVNKRTLAVILGDHFVRKEIIILLVLPFLLGAYWIWSGFLWAALLPFLVLPLVIKIIKPILKEAPSAAFNRYLGMAAGVQLVFALMISIGFWLNV